MYGFSTTFSGSFDDAITKVTEELSKEGFGVLTEINVKAVMKKKLDIDKRPYTILGACNPVLADKAITADADIGLLLPCNILVREDDDGTIIVAFMDPVVALNLVDKADMSELAAEVKGRLERVCNAM